MYCRTNLMIEQRVAIYLCQIICGVGFGLGDMARVEATRSVPRANEGRWGENSCSREPYCYWRLAHRRQSVWTMVWTAVSGCGARLASVFCRTPSIHMLSLFYPYSITVARHVVPGQPNTATAGLSGGSW